MDTFHCRRMMWCFVSNEQNICCQAKWSMPVMTHLAQGEFCSTLLWSVLQCSCLKAEALLYAPPSVRITAYTHTCRDGTSILRTVTTC